MKHTRHIRGFESFKNSRAAAQAAPIAEGYYYSKGKASRRSLLEMALISEGYSTDHVSAINEGYSLHKIDSRIIDCLYEYASKGTTEGLEMLTEEISLKQGFKNVYGKVSGAIDKGIEIGKNVITSFGNFLKSIGDVIKSLFGKIKAFFMKIWELFKPKAIAACAVIKKAVGGGNPAKMGKAIETISSEQGQTEIDSLSKDISALVAKFKTGDVGNTSPDTEEKLKGEAEEYKGVVDDQEIENLMKESVERKGILKRIYYMTKGFMSEGGTIAEMEKVFEAEEKKEWSAKEGEAASYMSKNDGEQTKKIVRIEGDNAVFLGKDGKEFTKPVADLKKPKEGMGEKLLQGFVGEEPEKKGIFGWLVEAVGAIVGWQAKLIELMYRGGTNGILTLVSALVKKSWKNATKFVVLGVVAGLVYHIIHGIGEILGGHEEGHGEGEHKEGAEGQGKEGVEVEAPEAPEKKVVAPADATAVKPPSTINLKKESLERIFEDAGVALDPKKKSKWTEFLNWDTLTKTMTPIVGSVLVSALSAVFMPHKLMEGILVAIGVFELVGALCKLDWVAKKGLKVCKAQHSVHHWLEGAVGGKAAH